MDMIPEVSYCWVKARGTVKNHTKTAYSAAVKDIYYIQIVFIVLTIMKLPSTFKYISSMVLSKNEKDWNGLSKPKCNKNKYASRNKACIFSYFVKWVINTQGLKCLALLKERRS